MSTYVGLTQAAKTWLKRCGFDVEAGTAETGLNINRYVMTETKEGKPIHGHIFHLQPLEGQKTRTAIEVIQVKVKDLVCTDLYIVAIENNGQETSISHCCSWVRDLSLKDDGVLVHGPTSRFCDV
jgi:hypothetical protein